MNLNSSSSLVTINLNDSPVKNSPDASPLISPPRNHFKPNGSTNSSTLSFFDQNSPNQIIKSRVQTNMAMHSPSSLNSELYSPTPMISFSPVKTTIFIVENNLSLILKEILVSEASYVENLKSLQDTYYHQVPSFGNVEIAIPIINTYHILAALYEIHKSLSVELQNLLKSSSVRDSKTIVNLISNKGVCVYWYRWYCVQHEIISKFIYHISPLDGDRLSKEWLQGWQNFMEGAQPNKRCKDLSFISLSHKPVDRIMKYKLFIENIKKDYVTLRLPLENLNESLLVLSESLNRINEDTRELTDKFNSIHSELKKLISIDIQYQKYSKFHDFHFFGHPIFIGICSLIYIKQSTPCLECCPVILFKSHLIICQYEKHHHRYYPFKRYSIKFIIPLVKCKLYNNEANCPGLEVAIKYELKLLFCLNLMIYEIVFCFLDQKDYQMWYDELITLIEFQNQNNKFADEQDQMIYLYQFPIDISALNINTNHLDFNSVRSLSYFKEVKIVHFKVDEFLKSKIDPENLIQGHMEQPSYSLTLTKQTLSINEKWFHHLVDKELTIYTDVEYSKISKLRRSLSIKRLRN